MKRVIFGAFIALAVASCGGEADVNDEVENIIDTEAVVEMENATNAVEEGLQDLENNINELNSDVDSLLNGI
ncbi:MAG: membrane lipoprotein lipid attachment site-containing protein [Crocinitomix sp.]|nr:membrane lipoprotein lipid attachment site-containing protein [Crocinitomix sp.]|tara:strand:- start:42150 stop:42365 length:216 start_codon:yes stop_codon:yes gene_type:complete